jgi:autotransporter-associated beta strand protein
MNTHSGGTILGQTGILYFTNAAAFGTGPITLLASGGALELNGSSAVTITNAVTAASVSLNIVGNPAGLTFSGPWDLGTTTPTLGTGNTPGNLVIISGVISGSGGLSLFDYGTLELTATNFYNGLTTNSTATLQLGDGVSRNGVVAGNIANNATLIFANPYPQTYSYLHAGIISGTGSLTKQGAGVLTLQGPNTYTGATTLSAGTLQVDYAEVPGTSGPLGASAAANAGSIVLSGGTLQYSSANKNDYSGRFSASSSAYNIDVNGQTVTFATSFTSSGAPLTLSDSKGGGKLTLSAANTYSGGTTVSAGTLDASVNGALGSGNVTVASGATLELDASGAINSAAELILNPGAPHVFLNYSGTNTIHAISLDGGATDGVAGVYGANGGANNPGGVFTGTGFLNVTTGSSAILSVTPNGGNSFTLKLVGTYQAQYYLVAQTNVAEPMANWHAVPGSTNTVTNPSGLWYVIVTNRAPAFYRARAM